MIADEQETEPSPLHSATAIADSGANGAAVSND